MPYYVDAVVSTWVSRNGTMVEYSNALAWMIVSPVAVLTDVVAVVVIAHYYPFFHGTDVMVTSLLCAMAANAIFVLPIPAFLELRSVNWSSSLCSAYVWCFITFRMVQMFSLVAMSLHWSTMLKMSAEKKKYFSTKTLKVMTIFIWLASAIVGIVPIIGAAEKDYNQNNECHFLGFDLGMGFAIFFLIFNIAAMFVSVICASDVTFLIKHMRKIAEVKYKTGRFYLPDKRAGVPNDGTCATSERYHRLNFAWDLSKFVLALVLLSFLVNHFPYAIIEGAQVFATLDRQTLEAVVLWLIGLEALLLPHALWILSKRYRHALIYIWKFYVLCQADIEEEDLCSCTLQSYTQKEKDRVSLAASAVPSVLGQNGGYRSASGTLRSNISDVRYKDHVQTNGQPNAVANIQDFDEISPNLRKKNGIVRGEVHVEHVAGSPHFVTSRDQTTSDEAQRIHVIGMTPPLSQVPDPDDEPGTSRKLSEASSVQSQASSARGSYLSPRQDVKRSSSGSSRKDWKDQMRKKHLPPIFVNEAFDGEDPKLAEQRIELARSSIYKTHGDNVSNSSLHYYMSSDYHPDYLTDSLPRHRFPATLEHSESEGASGQYEEGDISGILDDMAASPSGSHRATAVVKHKDSLGYEVPVVTVRAKLSTFSSPDVPGTSETSDYDEMPLPLPPFQERAVDVGFVPPDVREETEITFGNSSLPVDEIHEDVNSLPPYPQVVDTNRFRRQFQFPINRMDDKNSFQGRDIIEASTSFRRDQTSSPKLAEKDLQSTGSFRVSSSLDSSQTSSDSVFNGQTMNYTPLEEAEEDSNGTSGSSSSITLSPYKGETRRPPWLDEETLNLQLSAPYVEEIDRGAPRGLTAGGNLDPRLSDSGMSTPIFDEETDRGFEEALDIHHVNPPPSMSVYGGVGLCFESIKEEPEDYASSSSNPFLDDASINGDETFKTQAVVSRRSDSRSTSSSTSMVSDGVPHTSPTKSPEKDGRSSGRQSGNATPVAVIVDQEEIEFADSGFASGVDTSNLNTSECSPFPEAGTSGKVSPWPDSDELVKDTDQSFESDFSDRPFSDTSGSSREPREGEFPRDARGRKVTKRGRSFDSNVTPTRLNLPRRGQSMEEVEMDVQPAYF